MSSEVQTMADLDGGDEPSALRTPLYLIVSGFGLIMLIATFLDWASGRSGRRFRHWLVGFGS